MQEQISALQVLKSAAGYYLGHTYLDQDSNAWFPWDRVTGYFATKEEAEAQLKLAQEEGEV